MNRIHDFERNALYFVPLGGSEQFGVNLNVYISEGKILIVDCGLGFADDAYPGIDLLLPDPKFLEDNKENIVGMVITHAHEDHIGAVNYLWDRLGCPIYATEFTAVILRHKFAEGRHKNVPIHVVDAADVTVLSPFTLKFIPVAHSVPDTCALVIETPQGRVLHSGDWNLDPHPMTGAPTNAAMFRAEGDKGVLAYIGDSTNAQVAGRAGSEAEVEKGLTAEFAKCKRKIAVTIFSSNVGRIKSIARAAKANGRSVTIIGRSLHRMIGAAHECELLEDVPDFVSEEDMGSIPDENIVMIVTGSQGEARSALAKISRGDFNGVKLSKGDVVIFSARPIPGNEKSINAVKNNLSAAGVTIITPSDTENVIHVSGHPCQEEIAEMLSWVRPKIVIPVHGEHTQLTAHAAFARHCQVETTIVPNNGSVIKLAPGNPGIVDHVHTGLLAVDQKRIIESTHKSISARRKLQYTGAVHISIVLNSAGKIMGEPQLDTIGLIDEDSAGEIQIEDRLYDEILDVYDDMSIEDRADDHFVAEELRIAVRRFVYHILGIKPKATVHVIRV
jgi:ribonuclease J